MNVTRVDIPNSIHKFKQFYTTLEGAYLKHLIAPKDRTLPIDVVVTHDNKNVKAGIWKDNQKIGDTNPYFEGYIPTPQQDEDIQGDIFLLYDDCGLNYAHFFFDFFGKCIYFDEIRKTNPKVKLGILEEFYQETGNSTFIKQWLDLYYQDQDIEIIIFKKEVQYKVETLIIPNSFYWFPEGYGDDYIVEKIIETVAKVPKIEVKSNGCYISRQDTIKRGWYHGRDLINEVELIDQIQNELGYDIVELMDYDIIGKIQIFKSYPIIVQQSSASNINILFSNKDNTHVIISNPRMADWLNSKVMQFSQKSKANMVTLEGAGEYLSEYVEPNTNQGNYPWQLTNIEGIIEVLKQINNGNI
jgi:capsular polysaccharide biosynthesis protein